MRAIANHLLDDYESAVADLRKVNKCNPTVIFVRYWLAAALAQTGHVEDAEWDVEEVRGMGHLETRPSNSVCPHGVIRRATSLSAPDFRLHALVYEPMACTRVPAFGWPEHKACPDHPRL